jgi:hypothetical protein
MGNSQVLVSSDFVPTALSYSVQRSTDNITFAVVGTPVTPFYLDTTVVVGTEYYYQIAAVNGSGTGPYSPTMTIVPAPTSEMSLYQLRLSAQQRADRVNSNFVTKDEWDSYINQSYYELYDLLITTYENYFLAPAAQFKTTANQLQYPLPDGVLTFTGQNGVPFVAPPFYKLDGLDLSINNAQNAWVTVNKFNFIDRNKYIYPNSNSTIYGVFNLQYRVMGNTLFLIPPPTSNQIMQIWYVPRLKQLLNDTDLTTIGWSGWLEYVIVRAAILALGKEESDVSTLAQELIYLKDRIESSAQNRDEGRPDTISDVRTGYTGNGWGPIGNGSIGGW